MVYIRTGQYEKARAVLQQMTEIDPRDPDAYINLGVALNELGRGEEAVTALRRAVSLNPKQPLAYYNLGLTSMKLKRYDDAVAAFTQMTRLAPRDADSWIWLANAYEAKGLSREADAAYAKAYQLRTQRMRQ
jgi:Flp pilus assembly protein TadD